MAQLDAINSLMDDNDSDEDQPILCNLSALVQLMKKITNIIWNWHTVVTYLYTYTLEKNTSVKVHLRAEPLNPLYPSAIGIDLDFGTGSSHVGYITSELCKYLHPLWLQELLSMLMFSILSIGRLL